MDPDQPRAVLGQREAVQEFVDDGAAAVGDTVRTQAAWREIGRHDFERPAARRASTPAGFNPCSSSVEWLIFFCGSHLAEI